MSGGVQSDLKESRYRSDFRDWLTAISTLGTLIVAIVALWATIRVSGLQDYFQSEISRRNSEYKSALARADTLDIRSRNLRDAMDNLQKSYDALVVETQRQQTAYLDAKNRLDSVQMSELLARQSLFGAQAHPLDGLTIKTIKRA